MATQQKTYIYIITLVWIYTLSLIIVHPLNAHEASAYFHEKDSLVSFIAPSRSNAIRLKHAALGRDWLLASRVQHISQSKIGKVRLSQGQRLQNPLWIRFSLEGDSISIWRMDRTPLRGGKNNRQAWMTLPVDSIGKDYIVMNASPYLCQILEDLDPVAGRMSPEGIGADPEIISRRTHNRGLELSLKQRFKDVEVQLRHSLYLLPKKEMRAIRDDARVGYYTLFTKQLGKKQLSINKYPLVAGDKITYWVDSKFPPLWQRAIIAGIEDWNIAFRDIGLGDVLVAKPYPTNDPQFDPDDMRLNTFRFVESDFPNAQGKFWSDPRSGEIQQSDVLFFSSVKDLLYKWYYLQTAAYNPSARKAYLPDSAEFRLIRYAAAHEIGHCLGLEHNYRASASYPTDSLRSPQFTKKYGTTPSIMDYARLNNIAQQGDNVTAFYPPLLGAYDIFAIKYGYAQLSDAERSQLVDSAQLNPFLRYEKLVRGTGPQDPNVQPVGLGDDLLQSVDYALRNLRYILKHKDEWSTTNITTDDIAEAYYGNLALLTPYINGVFRHTLSADGKDVKVTPVPENYQQAVLNFLQEETKRAKRLFPNSKLGGKQRMRLEHWHKDDLTPRGESPHH